MEDLVQVLSKLPAVTDHNLLVGIETGDDAAVYRLNDDTSLILTVDFFTPITDDPYQFGAIAAANALSDVYAMGGKPLLALNIVGFPADLDKAVLEQILRGGNDKASEAGCLIVGGHTVDDAEPKYGLSVIGLVDPGKHVTNAGARPGDSLVLTKALGAGIITTGGKQGKSPAAVMQAARREHVRIKPGGRRCDDESWGQRLHRRYRLWPAWAPEVNGRRQRSGRPGLTSVKYRRCLALGNCWSKT